MITILMESQDVQIFQAVNATNTSCFCTCKLPYDSTKLWKKILSIGTAMPEQGVCTPNSLLPGP